ncbi:RHS repeat-associated core domain-containing protein [Epilithonimonas hominis]|uniref:RHS repeat-associated core domain-containing protein n=1 Tax=Epilithonimonas hominis TaxID=420404 RepID=UPI0028A1572D|nr:RHS repeat-associated core domain-containing protein [Epilithonimonas hominis]
MKLYISTFFFFLLTVLIPAQEQVTEIPLQYDTSGYAENIIPDFANKTGVDPLAPTVNAEMSVNEIGALTYMIPIEGLKGVNNFQPNIALAYNSQSGYGTAGWGWNIIGTSAITRGGKSKNIDGITQGPQFDNNDPFYLDGQRLIKLSDTNFVTEKFSKIKITKQTSGEFSFIIQYTDGKIAKYKELVSGQNYISKFIDSFNNEINYSYQIENNVPRITSVTYGGSNNPFTINFEYKLRSTPTEAYRNEIKYTSKYVLSSVTSNSSYDGIYRKYSLTHDYINGNSTERLIKVDVENKAGDKLKPLTFDYNIGVKNGVIEKSIKSNAGMAPNTKELGDIVAGDFFGKGELSTCYISKDVDGNFSVISSVNGKLPFQVTAGSRLIVGKTLDAHNKITDRDQLIIAQTGFWATIEIIDLVTYSKRVIDTSFKSNFTWVFNWQTGQYQINETNTDDYITGDFNNDGLIDLIHFLPGDALAGIPNEINLYEIGKTTSSSTTTIPLSNTNNTRGGDQIYQIEMDGDGIPEVFIINGTKYSIFKIDFLNKTFSIFNNLKDIPLNDFYNEIAYAKRKTPLIFGDFNGDGLTDFMTPKKVYYIDADNSTSTVVKKMETEQLLWWEYISTGKGFNITEKNYTSQKLAYLMPSQRNYAKASGSFWQKLWSGPSYVYDYTEYGATTIIPTDFNNDGKTDLMTFSKFGRVKYSDTQKLNLATIENKDILIFNGVYPSPSLYTNKIYFHENKSSAQGSTNFNPLPTVLPLNADLISPLSIPLQSTDFNKLSTYRSSLIISDPLTRKDFSFTVNNDKFTEGLIKKVDNGSTVQQLVEYKPMMVDANSNTERCYTKNSNADGFSYPYYVHKNNGSTYLVNKIHTTFSGKILTREYRFENAIQQLDGKGFLGFQKTFFSDAYESVFQNNIYKIKDPTKAVFWTISTRDPLNENSIINSTYGGLKKFITETKTVNKKFNRANNQYLILSTDEETKDYLRKITVSKKYNYDANDDLKLKTSYTDYNGIGSTITKFTYKQEFNDGDHYHYGAIESVEDTTYKDGLSFTTKKVSNYNSNGAVSESYQYSNDANAPPIVNSYAYDSNGNIISETISTQGITNQTTAYQYDTTKRYVTKTTAPDGLFSSTVVNPLGKISEETSSLGLKTYYSYDNWGNVTEITDYLGKKTTISKSVSNGITNGIYNLSKKREGGVETIATFDEFDREIQSKTQSINGKWLVAKTEYDIFGRKSKYSEPFFEGDVIKWSEIKYDEQNRPVENILYTGVVVKTCYEGLKVTVDDGYKKTSKTLDAMGNTVRHQDHGGVIGYSYFPNGALKETNYEGIKTTFEIDGWGNKKKITDPSAGIFEYEYDNLSRLTKEKNPKGETVFTYDTLGRPLTEVTTGKTAAENTNISKTYTYNANTKLPEKITGTSNGKTFTYTTLYDQYYRIKGKTEQTPDFTYSSTTTFDAFGRADEITISTQLINPSYTSSSKMKNVYDSNGILIQQNDVTNGNMIWHISSADAKGRTLEMEYGNGYQLSTNYNANTYGLEKISHNRNGINILDIGYDFDMNKGVLNKRHNFTFSKEEKFTYDVLNRLLSETVNNILTNEYTYDKRGRITSNTELGKYKYNENDYKLQSIEFNTNGQNVNTQRGFAQVTYNAFKSPLQIILAGKENLSFEYNILKTRYSTVSSVSGETKYFSSDFAVEIKKKGNITELITYLTGDPYSANYIKKEILQNGTLSSKNNYYLHRDNIGSIIAITKTDGSVAEKRFFDAWGNLKAIVNASGQMITDAQQLINYNFLIDRGYTGHEHLWKAGLVNMNARIYDPVLRKFLSPDNLVQDPYNTQSYDRYSYVFNNPLLYIDIDGNEGITAFVVAVAIAVAVGVATHIVMNAIAGVPVWYGLGKAATTSAIMGAISFGIGTAASTAFGAGFSWGGAAFQAGMHAVSGGIMSVLETGNLGSGFLSGAISSIVASGIQGLGTVGGALSTAGEYTNFASRNPSLLKAIMVTAGGLSGGISSVIAGGSFWDGMRQGIITSGLNHALHDFLEDSVKADTATKDDRERYKETRNKYYELYKNSQFAEALSLVREAFKFGKNLEKYFSGYDIRNDKETAFYTITEEGASTSTIEIHTGLMSNFGTAVRALYHEWIHVYQHHLLKDNYIFDNHFVREYDAYDKTIRNRLLPSANYDWSGARMKAWGEIPQYLQKNYKTFIKNNPYDIF